MQIFFVNYLTICNHILIFLRLASRLSNDDVIELEHPDKEKVITKITSGNASERSGNLPINSQVSSVAISRKSDLSQKSIMRILPIWPLSND